MNDYRAETFFSSMVPLCVTSYICIVTLCLLQKELNQSIDHEKQSTDYERIMRQLTHLCQNRSTLDNIVLSSTLYAVVTAVKESFLCGQRHSWRTLRVDSPDSFDLDEGLSQK